MSDPPARAQSGLPRSIVESIQEIFRHSRRYFPEGTLTLGGGTVLQARWSHRRSTDADLFCSPEIFEAVVRTYGIALEEALRSLADDPGQTFVDRIATYARIGGTEVTILPAIRHLGERTFRYVPETGIETWSNADILAGKLLHRIYEGGVVEPRDLYDVAAAARHDPAALRKATHVLTPRQQHAVRSRLALLPEHWADASDKPLLGLPQEPYDFRPKSIIRLLEDAAQPAPESAPIPGDNLEPGG